MSDQVVQVLTAVPGIGTWTAEIYAMFALGRADVFAAGDLALQEAALGDGAAFRRLDGRFHHEIAQVSGNPIWTALSDGLFRWLNDFHVDVVSVPGKENVTLAEHRGIISAIQSGNPDRAAEAMADHLNRANDLYRRPERGV